MPRAISHIKNSTHNTADREESVWILLPPVSPRALSLSLTAARLIHRAAKRSFLPVTGSTRAFGEWELSFPCF